MDILIVAHFAELPQENDNCRFSYLAKLLLSKGHSVEIVCSSFSHIKKQQRNDNIDELFTLIYEPGYKRNVSIKRILSHKKMAENLRQYLRKREKPDVIYCAVPSLDVAEAAALYAKEKNIKFIIDVQDLWPEAFKMVFDLPIVSDIIFYPMAKKANNIYGLADKIVAVSETYKERVLSVNFNAKEALSVFLGTELERFDEIAKAKKSIKKGGNEFWVAYIGTLGHSYDIKTVIDAIDVLSDKGISNIKFVVMGDGPLESEFKEYAKNKGILSWFTGRLPYTEMISLLSSCNIAVNPISKGAAGSIINKVGDYAAASLPVLNTQECIEYRNLIEKYYCGYNCNNGDAIDLAEKMELLYNDNELVAQMGSNNRRLAEEYFDRAKTYDRIVEMIIK